MVYSGQNFIFYVDTMTVLQPTRTWKLNGEEVEREFVTIEGKQVTYDEAYGGEATEEAEEVTTEVNKEEEVAEETASEEGKEQEEEEQEEAEEAEEDTGTDEEKEQE